MRALVTSRPVALGLGFALLLSSIIGASSQAQEAVGPLVVEIGEFRLTLDRQNIAAAEARTDGMNQPTLFIKVIPSVGETLAEITTQNVGRQLTFRLGEQIIFEPVIREPIVGDEFEISGMGMTQEQIQRVVDALN